MPARDVSYQARANCDVVSLIRAVRRAGFTGPYCVECNTPTFAALPVDEAARRAADTARGVLHAAGVTS